MESKGRRTEIQIETHEVKVIRFRKNHALALCEVCGEIVTALTPRQTAEVLETTQREVFRLLEAGRAHLVKADRGMALICGKSFGAENEFVRRKALSTNL